MPEGDSVFRLAARLRRSLDGRTLSRGDLRVAAHATTPMKASFRTRRPTSQQTTAPTSGAKTMTESR